ncbi:MAG: glycosyltransferase family 2 protein [Chloroflexota bacterium]
MRVALYVPCYNGAAWLEECVNSLLAQTWPVCEVAVIDDGSTDSSAAIARRFGSAVRLIQHDRNRGLAVARNTALTDIECDVLASVDADVNATPDWLAHLLIGFDSPSAGAVGGKLIEAHQTRVADRWRAAHMAQHAGDFPLRDAPTLAGANMAVRRRVARELGGYDETLRTNYEDADLRVRLTEHGYRCAYVPDAQAYHLRTDTSKTVLRTYWGWLRPPAERRGAFSSAQGLAARRRDVWERTVRALWREAGDAQSELAYVSLLMGLAFPIADAHHAAQRAAERGATDEAAVFASIGAAWGAAVQAALSVYSSPLAVHVSTDLKMVAWWRSYETTTTAPPLDLLDFAPRAALERVPRAWWRRIESARTRLAQDEGWPGYDAGSAHASPPEMRPDAIALIEHGPPTRRESLMVTREHRRSDSASTNVVEVASHRIGWMAPSCLQASLLHTGTIVWGEPAALEAVPAWRPEQIDPLSALDLLGRAERLLAAEKPDEARSNAIDALLIARRLYSPYPEDRIAELGREWPALPTPETCAVDELLRSARRLIESWLFTWRGAGMSQAARRRWQAMRDEYASSPTRFSR